MPEITMTKLTLLSIAIGSLAGCGGKNDAMGDASKARDELCHCRNAACADAANEKLNAAMDRLEKDFGGKEPDKATQEKLHATMEEAGKCLAPWKGSLGKTKSAPKPEPTSEAASQTFDLSALGDAFKGMKAKVPAGVSVAQGNGGPVLAIPPDLKIHLEAEVSNLKDRKVSLEGATKALLDSEPSSKAKMATISLSEDVFEYESEVVDWEGKLQKRWDRDQIITVNGKRMVCSAEAKTKDAAPLAIAFCGSVTK